ncbi:APC family permease [Synechococcus sp. CCY9201]|uniref:APC family permease n=1 Tax=unclassified Synechococcus TaxID=2626047 RepID=UPI0018CF8CA2|nr:MULTISPECIES: APC family permease [unclassified Synechococcus]MEA5474372.1 APC family permease [Synechococcus sp. CCY9201]QPN65779.1 APC family permease [Synechococcus sp. CBW1006]
MDLIRRLFGKPLPRSEAEAERLPSYEALPILSSDALSSVAYATEAALGVLILAGSRALELSLPITLAIIALIAVVVFSFRQTIEAYPQGGGSYVVARENLGTAASLVAAASLLVDYTLTAAVSLMAGTQALSSLLPGLLRHEVAFALLLLLLVGWANLRGVREAGQAFALPTYAFVLMVALLALGGLQDLVFHHGFQPDPPPLIQAVEPLGLFLILRAFSSGCSAMTGIEAIANGVKLFRQPAATRARATMLVMGLMLAAMFFCVSGLGFLYGVAPDPNRTVLAQIGLRVFGAGSPLLWALQITTLLILVLAANTAFAGFPRLAAMLAQDRFLPRQMGWLGDRLVFQNGITTLVLATAVIIVVCRGDTTVAVNLYALGVFMAFTLSQTGMVVLWWRQRGPGWHGRLLMNALGAITTCVVLVVIVLSKFSEGAWTVVIAIPLLVALLARIRRRYRRVYAEIAVQPDQVQPVRLPQRHEPIGNRSIVWLTGFSRPSLDALHYAARVSDQVVAVWVLSEDDDPAAIQADWLRLVGDEPQVELRLVDSPFASLIQPFVAVVEAEENRYPASSLTIVMPMAIPRYRFDSLLLNQRAINMRQALDAQHNRVFTVVRYYLPA